MQNTTLQMEFVKAEETAIHAIESGAEEIIQSLPELLIQSGNTVQIVTHNGQLPNIEGLPIDPTHGTIQVGSYYRFIFLQSGALA